MFCNPIPPCFADTFEEIGANQMNSDLDGPFCRTRTPLSSSTSTGPQSFPIPSKPDLDMVPSFPVEIYEHIIDQSEDLDGSLCRFSLTCRAFLPRARLNLFFRIHIGHKEKLESASAFLESRPWLPPLVRCLTIRDYIIRYPFMVLTVVPVRLLGMLPSLRSLELALDWGGTGPFPNRSRMALAFRPSTLPILCKSYAPIRNLELVWLRFKSLPDLFRLLCALPHLNSLVIKGRIDRNHAGDIGPFKNKILYLTHLVIDVLVDSTVLRLLLDMCEATLENLRMGIRPDNHSRRDDTATGTSSRSPIPIPTMSMIIAQLRHLRVLTLELPWPWPGLQLVSEILSKMPPTGALQYLNIVYGAISLTSLAFYPPSDFTLFRHALEESISRLSLHQVVFSPTHHRKNRQGLWSSALHLEFSALKERGILTITETPSHLDRPLSWPQQTALGHDRLVSSLIVSPDGRFFASSSKDGTIILWDTRQGTIIREWVAHSPWHSTDQPDGVLFLAVSPDSRYLLSSGGDRTVKLWDTSDKLIAQAQVLETSEEMPVVTHGSWSADGMWIAGTARYEYPGNEAWSLHIWNAYTFCQQRVLTEPSINSHHSFSADSRWLMWFSSSPSDDSARFTVSMLDTLALDEAPATRRFPFHPDDGPPRSVSLDPTGKKVVSIHPRHLRIWDLAAGAPFAIMAGHAVGPHSAAFSPDGQYVLSVSEDGTARVWLAGSGECTESLEGRTDCVMQALFSPDGNYIATTSMNKTVRLWKTNDGSCLATFTDHESSVRCIVFSPDGQMLASGDDKGVVRICDISHFTGQ